MKSVRRLRLSRNVSTNSLYFHLLHFCVNFHLLGSHIVWTYAQYLKLSPCSYFSWNKQSTERMSMELFGNYCNSTKVLKYFGRKFKRFWALRKLILRNLSSFINFTTECFGGFSMIVSSGTKLNRNPLAGLFTEGELAGMLHATDIDKINKSSTSFCAIVDTLCWFWNKATLCILKVGCKMFSGLPALRYEIAEMTCSRPCCWCFKKSWKYCIF